ncbi:hypothetical protein AAFX24_28595 [Vibrio mediterranei]|uniref:hypothetical protein n=1 Tax=Vibrio mediterranei TaxID=689 RepID=UPI0038CEBBFC
MKKTLLLASLSVALIGCTNQIPQVSSNYYVEPEITISKIDEHSDRYQVFYRDTEMFMYLGSREVRYDRFGMHVTLLQERFQTGSISYRDLESDLCYSLVSNLIKIEKKEYFDIPILDVQQSSIDCPKDAIIGS